MKNKTFLQILTILLVSCSMINRIQEVSGWWVFLLMAFIISLVLAGYEAKKGGSND